jgi:hypothetical protein
MKTIIGREQETFLALLRAGLWEEDVNLPAFGEASLPEMYRLASEQSVVGLVAAGLGHVTGLQVPAMALGQFIASIFPLEKRNGDMNAIVEKLVTMLQVSGVTAMLVKGQGIAQCYDRPLWRSCADVDLLVRASDYVRAKAVLLPKASHNRESAFFQHLELTIDGWEVEVHGTLHTGLSGKIDRGLDTLQEEIFVGDHSRVWQNGETRVFIPAPDYDVLFVFCHILQHFFRGGIGLRQICDWCRLLWTFRDSLDVVELEKRLREMQVMSEWHVFAALAVDMLGMPTEAMPLYDGSVRWERKSRRALEFILEVGNFGSNRDTTYYHTQPYLIRKMISFGWRMKDLIRHSRVFPLDSLRFSFGIVRNGLSTVFRRE